MAKNEYIDVIADASSVFYKAPPIYQYDTGIMVRVKNLGLTLPEMHWSNGVGKAAITTIPEFQDGDVVGVIPDLMLIQDRDIHCYLYIKKESIGYTRIEIVIPIIARQKPSDVEFTPGQTAAVEGLIGLLNEATTRAEEAVADANEAQDNANVAIETARSISEVLNETAVVYEPTFVTTANYTTFFSDADNAKKNTVYSQSSSFSSAQIAHLPKTPISGTLFTYGGGKDSKNGRVQFFVSTTNQFFWRTCASNTWTAWTQGATEDEIETLQRYHTALSINVTEPTNGHVVVSFKKE